MPHPRRGIEGLFEFGDRDGRGSWVRLQHPLGVAVHDGILYVADTSDYAIRVADLNTREVTTLAITGRWQDPGQAPRKTRGRGDAARVDPAIPGELRGQGVGRWENARMRSYAEGMMSLLLPQTGMRRYGSLPPFDPADGRTVLPPPREAPGNWVGASDVIFDDRAGRFYLYARTRRPKDPADPDQRGARCAILESRDGLSFHEIWSAHRTRLDTVSIEKGSLLVLPDGRHRLYVSFECPGGRGWQIDLLEGASFAALDAAQRRTVLTPAAVGAGHVKDPVAVLAGGLTLLYANVSVPGGGEAAGLAVSADGVRFEWRGRVLPASPEGAWDSWTSRATGILYAHPAWYLLYDGAAAGSECYEEQMGVAVAFTPDGPFTRLTPGAPYAPGQARGGLRYDNDRILPSLGAMRYVTPLVAKNRMWYYYEWTRPDGAHELRVVDYDL